MRDEGHVAPAAAPAVFVPLRSFVLPCTRSYSPALIGNYSPAFGCTPPCSFVPSCTSSYPPCTLRTCLHSFLATAAVGVGTPAVPAPVLFVLVHATRSCSFGLYLHSLVLVRAPLSSFICIKCKVSTTTTFFIFMMGFHSECQVSSKSCSDTNFLL